MILYTANNDYKEFSVKNYIQPPEHGKVLSLKITGPHYRTLLSVPYPQQT